MRTFKVETVTGRLPEIKADGYDTYNTGELIFTTHNNVSHSAPVKVATFAKGAWSSVVEKTEEW
jgi:hypothetical protein